MQAIDARTHPRAGIVYVNAADGSFEEFTSHLPGDGVVPEKHRVLILDTIDTLFYFQIPKS